jgi:hypothetical protein
VADKPWKDMISGKRCLASLAVIITLVAGAIGAALAAPPPVLMGVIDKASGLVLAALYRDDRDKNYATAENPSRQVIADSVAAWLPLTPTADCRPGKIKLGKRVFDSLETAAGALADGETLLICEGTYRGSVLIEADNTVIRGEGHVVLAGAAESPMATLVVKGNRTRVDNIECRGSIAADENGACLRLVGKHLILNHVYFHSSQQGILTTGASGEVEILDSRFENLGHGGRAHGIYVGGDSLTIRDSLFLAMKNGGHAVKSRARHTEIEGSTIASLASNGSRLVDVSNGGTLVIRRSVLQQGYHSDNWDIIGYGLESLAYAHNEITLENNLFIMERRGPSGLLNAPGSVTRTIGGNTFIGGWPRWPVGSNRYFFSRAGAGIEAYPYLPPAPAD